MHLLKEHLSQQINLLLCDSSTLVKCNNCHDAHIIGNTGIKKLDQFQAPVETWKDIRI